MASDADSVKASTTPLVRGIPAPTSATANPSSGKPLPPGSTSAAALATNPKPAKPVEAAKPPPDLPALLAQLNKHLQSSGRPNHYKLDSSSGHRVIQEINPDTREVVSEIPANEFKALAQSLGVSGLLFDAHA
ncbi:MAG TPA: flagellar protein FlaG [Steroidobacteraceae bacterium]|nr:flagellar protein FlaG [Steroidobacteraceae bacterium]